MFVTKKTLFRIFRFFLNKDTIKLIGKESNVENFKITNVAEITLIKSGVEKKYAITFETFIK